MAMSESEYDDFKSMKQVRTEPVKSNHMSESEYDDFKSMKTIRTFEIPQPRRVLTLKELIARLTVIAETKPETLNNPIQINFDMGAFRDVEAVWVKDNSVILSEDE